MVVLEQAVPRRREKGVRWLDGVFQNDRHTRPMTTTAHRATALLALHTDQALLRLVNVWDVASARVVAAVAETKAIATASHSIAAMYGYPDGEQIPRDLMLEAVGRVVEAVDLPVTADLEAGYGDAADTVRRAIGLGVVGCNIEDQLKPLGEATAVVERVMEAASKEGIDDFVLNARTDAFVRGGGRDPDEVLDDAITRGQAYLAAGAPVVFVPGRLSEAQVVALVDAFGPQKLTLLPAAGAPSLARLEELGVARVSFGPYPQRVALTALQEMVEGVVRGEGIPAGTRQLT
jgi:2-methylisocitrate lyase-like PEP mutase family enzyme